MSNRKRTVHRTPFTRFFHPIYALSRHPLPLPLDSLPARHATRQASRPHRRLSVQPTPVPLSRLPKLHVASVMTPAFTRRATSELRNQTWSTSASKGR